MIRTLFLALLFSMPALAQDPDPKPDMHVLAQEIISMQKYIFSDAEFSSPQNDSAINQSFDKLNEHIAHLGTGAFANDPALKVNLSLLQQHMLDAKRSFKEGSKLYSKYTLQSSLQMCIACHTRMKTNDFPLATPNMEKSEPINQGDFLFATRQFEKGKLVFQDLIAGYPENKASQSTVRKALLSLAIYYAKVKEDPKAGADYFQSVVTKNNLPLYTLKEITAWTKDFTRWSNEKNTVDLAKLTESELLSQAKKILRYDDFGIFAEDDNFHIRRLRASAILNRILESSGARSPAKGMALYYLGEIYHRTASDIFFRFGEMYLKSCITDYKKTAVARDCYVALEQAVAEGYTGSAGTDIPEDEQVELMRLKHLAY